MRDAAFPCGKGSACDGLSCIHHSLQPLPFPYIVITYHPMLLSTMYLERFLCVLGDVLNLFTFLGKY